MKDIYLIEDHDEALKIWRRRGVKGRDLIHIDAHIDLKAPAARPIEDVLEDAQSVRDVKKGLEELIAFRWYEKDLGKQTHIGNYIYPALRQGIVRDFYWVVPGRLKDFRSQARLIKDSLRHALGDVASLRIKKRPGLLVAAYLGHKIVVCCLDSLPFLREPVLLDVDTDFFVTPSLRAAEPTRFIGCHRAWISPPVVAGLLRTKGVRSMLTTIAYSTRGGFTPTRFRYLGDVFAQAWRAYPTSRRLKKKEEAAGAFAAFEKSGSALLYRRAIRLDPGLRYADNHLGYLYLARRRLRRAQREFVRILKADPTHAGAWLGCGDLALARHENKKALACYVKAERLCRQQKEFRAWFKSTLLGQLQSLVKMECDKKARELSGRLRKSLPLSPDVYFWSGVLSERAGDYRRAARYFQDAIRLGYEGSEPLKHLSKISCFFDPKDDIIDYINRIRTFHKSRAHGSKIRL